MEKIIKSPLKAIRANCIECVGTFKEVQLCTSKKCNLYLFRFGKNPHTKRKPMSEEQKKNAVERLKKARESKNKNACKFCQHLAFCICENE